MRFDPKLQYLAELAARLKGISLREYIESAVLQSFERVSVDSTDFFAEPVYGSGPDDFVAAAPKVKSPEEERLQSLAHNADKLWDDTPYTRLEMLCMAWSHLATSDDEQFFNFLHTRPKLKLKAENGYRMDRKKIADDWQQSKAAFDKASTAKRGK
jgi:hypothetical protein